MLRKRCASWTGFRFPLPYDYLVLATGVQHSYFGHDEYAAYAPGLKTLTDAVQLRNKILGAFEACERTLAPQDHPELLTFVIVGGGPTGVELAGAIAELARPNPGQGVPSLRPRFAQTDPRGGGSPHPARVRRVACRRRDRQAREAGG